MSSLTLKKSTPPHTMIIAILFFASLSIEPSMLNLLQRLSTCLTRAISFAHKIHLASAITCYKCRSVNNNNYGCNDPFSDGQVERRECPAYERCAKITGTNNNGQYFVIRDCYKTNFGGEQRQSYREKRIQYYQVLKVRDVLESVPCVSKSD